MKTGSMVQSLEVQNYDPRLRLAEGSMSSKTFIQSGSPFYELYKLDKLIPPYQSKITSPIIYKTVQ